MAPHVIPWYRAEDRATRDALEVQACKECGAVLWRREMSKDKPAYAPGALVGNDCPGSEENDSMAKKTTSRVRKARPKQVELPGTEDSAIGALEAKAKELRENRDEIAELKTEQAKIEAALISLMHKHGKKTYMRHGIEIVLVGSSEKVKVRYPDDEGGDAGGE